MRADFPIVLDANILAESAISDLFLQLSEEPRLVSPRWTEKIWEECTRFLARLVAGHPAVLAQGAKGSFFPNDYVVQNFNAEQLAGLLENLQKSA